MKIERTQHKKSQVDLEETYHANYKSGERKLLNAIGYSRIMQADNTPFESLIVSTINGDFHIKKSKPYELRGLKKILKKYAPKLAEYLGIKKDLGFDVYPNPESAKKIYDSLDELTKKEIKKIEHISKMLRLFFVV